MSFQFVQFAKIVSQKRYRSDVTDELVKTICEIGENFIEFYKSLESLYNYESYDSFKTRLSKVQEFEVFVSEMIVNTLRNPVDPSFKLLFHQLDTLRVKMLLDNSPFDCDTYAFDGKNFMCVDSE